ncbi:membrane protease YdiL (CAAX protease family) [Marmoricola sp. OAE513]|uniref:CPBP family intramembrane glutamic endopeptidase n=1 Tax=Marmoricola sp. OAE513 TaxID=2817894 RepID=UPI001AEA7B20
MTRARRLRPVRDLFRKAAEKNETRPVVVRRRKVVAGTSVLGASLLGAGLSTEPGSRAFYGTTGAVAGIWTVGGFASGPLHRGWTPGPDNKLRRPLLTPLALGVGAFGAFYGAALVARRIPVLDRAISGVLDYADEGDDKLVLATTLANGIGEEIFFRGALYAALPEKPVLASTAIYTLSTTTTRNPALVLAAGVMGTLFGLQRRASGGLQAPVITHLTWSTLMLRFLPPLFRKPLPEHELPEEKSR